MIDIFDIKLQFFPGKIWLSKPIGELTLRQFIESQKNPKPEIKQIFKKIAQAEKNEDWETKGKLKQENLYYFTPCIKLDGNGRAYKNIQSFRSIMVLDFDHLSIDADEFRDRIFKKYKSIICAYKSPSSNGVKCLVKIPRVNSVEEFKQYFYGFAFYMEKVPSFDQSCKNPCLPLFLSWDENIRWREDPQTWGIRGGKHDEFEPYTGDFDEIEDVSDKDKKTALKIVYKRIKRADEENVGHPNVLSAALLGGGYCVSGYYTYEEIKNYLFKWIDESPYLSAKADTYKKTAINMIERGMQAPLFLKKHQDRQPEEIAQKKDKPKKDRKYYLLTNLNKFSLERTKENTIFGGRTIKIEEF